MREEKERPRWKEGLNFTQTVFNCYKKETEDFIQKNNNLSNLKFYIFQTIREKTKIRDMIFNMSYFYDQNYIGNKDFIHIPRINDIINNTTKYPIIVASKQDDNRNEEILGITTIKFENNEKITDNPYFPTINENVLSITGILSKMNAVDKNNNRIRKIGVYLFQTAIEGAYYISQKEKIRLMCQIDCRNTKSLHAICEAIENLKIYGIDDINSSIIGYYDIYDLQNDLIEAPTFIIEISFTRKNINNRITKFSYYNCNGVGLLEKLDTIIKENTREINQYINFNKDRKIVYHEIEPIDAQNLILEVGASADGNERIPELQIEFEKSKIKYC